MVQTIFFIEKGAKIHLSWTERKTNGKHSITEYIGPQRRILILSIWAIMKLMRVRIPWVSLNLRKIKKNYVKLRST